MGAENVPANMEVNYYKWKSWIAALREGDDCVAVKLENAAKELQKNVDVQTEGKWGVEAGPVAFQARGQRVRSWGQRAPAGEGLRPRREAPRRSPLERGVAAWVRRSARSVPGVQREPSGPASPEPASAWVSVPRWEPSGCASREPTQASVPVPWLAPRASPPPGRAPRQAPPGRGRESAGRARTALTRPGPGQATRVSSPGRWAWAVQRWAWAARRWAWAV